MGGAEGQAEGLPAGGYRCGNFARGEVDAHEPEISPNYFFKLLNNLNTFPLS